ncbi:MAG TPA: class I SAM-dependent methyltransferase [Steroidobacteraceae bacterium]|nr:class I SAM-dependent methyltransferase [Steroidobacteraceae bacterium]
MNSLIAKLGRKVTPHLLPKSAVRSLSIRKEKRELTELPSVTVEARALITERAADVRAWLGADLTTEWNELVRVLDPIRFGDKAGAVNPGDQRALYYIARAVKPRAVLEVGTHLAASTSMLALGMRQSAPADARASLRVTTVDIVDVNDPARGGAWKRLGCSQSPADFLRGIGCDGLVQFVNQPSLQFLRTCQQRFDLIFLDGDHAARTVYHEVPAALGLLNDGGVILLHDFFPESRPLWADGYVVPGPQLAVQRLREEAAPLVVKPLGALPWPTKQNSNVSSLAVLCRRE